MTVAERDEVWIHVSGQKFEARIYQPDSGQNRPAILDVHGGAWTIGDRTNGALYDRALAEAGFVVVAIDFRMGPDHQHPAASEDVLAGVRWIRLNAERLGVDADRIGILGSSSGGHLALLAGVKPSLPPTPDAGLTGGDETGNAHETLSSVVDYVIALWPVSDPFFRYRYARRAGLERLVKAHDAYYVTEDAMRDASVPRVVTSGEADHLPPALIVQPGEDSNVPVEMTFDLLRAWQSRGGHIEYAHFPDQPHAFGHRPSEATSRMVALITDFARRNA